jgi:hypothetical protein
MGVPPSRHWFEMGRSVTDRHISWSGHVGPHTEEATVMPGKGAKDLCVGIETRLRPRDHGAADTRLARGQSDRSYLDLLPDP